MGRDHKKKCRIFLGIQGKQYKHQGLSQRNYIGSQITLLCDTAYFSNSELLVKLDLPDRLKRYGSKTRRNTPPEWCLKYWSIHNEKLNLKRTCNVNNLFHCNFVDQKRLACKVQDAFICCTKLFLKEFIKKCPISCYSKSI